MSSVSVWQDTPFDDKEAFDDFILVHAIVHDKIAAVMYGQDLQYTTYPLLDTPDYNRDWMLTHQQEHQSIYNLLGLSGLPDFATTDLSEEGPYQDFMLLHTQVHQQIGLALGIT